MIASPRGQGNAYADIDLDLANPLQDAVSLAVHAREVIEGDTTDELTLWATLMRDPAIARFIPYDVVAGA